MTRALLIGGGIAGPAAALFLQRAAIDVEVFEAYPAPANVGGGFQLAPNGMRVLAELGLADAVRAHGAIADGFTFLNHHGRILGTVHPDRAGKATTTMRAPFYRALLAATDHVGIRIHYGKRLLDLTYDGGEVIAHFTDGTTARGDLVIGADGVHSRVRALALPDRARPRYLGMLGIGGIADARAIEACGLDPAARTVLSFVLGPHLTFGYARMDAADHWGWWCHLPQPDERPHGAFETEALRGRLAAAFAGWCDPIGPMLAATPELIHTSLYDVPELPAWSAGRVVLIGDAAHAMSPAAGQGASLALEDASVLAEVLGNLEAGAWIEPALAAFEQRRRARVEAIARTARDTDARALKWMSRFGCWMRDRAFPLFAPMISRSLEQQYGAAI